MNALVNKRVVLIGGAGFIGHNLALALSQLGCHVEIIDSLQINNLLSIASGHSNTHNRDLYLQNLDDYHRTAVQDSVSDEEEPIELVEPAKIDDPVESEENPFAPEPDEDDLDNYNQILLISE